MENAANLCPSCSAALPDTGQFPSWCPACNWNVEAEHSIIEWKHSALDKLIHRIRARHAEKQYAELIAREPQMKRAAPGRLRASRCDGDCRSDCGILRL